MSSKFAPFIPKLVTNSLVAFESASFTLSVEFIVKLGYVPVTVVHPVPCKTTVWSGAVFVIVFPDKSIAVPGVKAGLDKLLKSTV
jgi:hypothetical protein